MGVDVLLSPTLDRERVRRAAVAGTASGIAGALAIVAIVVNQAAGPPWDAISNLAYAAMIVTIAPVMLGAYELGGVTPLWPARASLGAGMAACLVVGIVHLAYIAGLVTFDYLHPASGAFLVENLGLLVVGAWLTGAPPLAGPWMPRRLRWLGAIAGLGFVFTAVELLIASAVSPLAVIGAIGVDVVYPVWALMVARVFRACAAATSPARTLPDSMAPRPEG